jgi:hypothetical protein
MAHEYTLGTFLRQTPKSVLKDYFDRIGLLRGVNFQALSRRKEESIITAMDGLGANDRAKVDQEFQDIFVLANKAGTQIVLDMAKLSGLEIADQFEKMENHYHRAMWLFLNHGGNGAFLFATCLRFALMKELSFTNSKRRKNLPMRAPRHDKSTLDMMTGALQAVYRRQGRGHRCVVEHAIRPNPTRHCFFAYPEDYTTSELQYEGDVLARRSRKSVFHVVFVFRPDEGILEICGPGQKNDIQVLQEVFCRHALEMDRLPPPMNDRCFDLNGLKSPDFGFPTNPEDNIEKVEVVALRMNFVATPRKRISFEQDPNSNETLHAWIRAMVKDQLMPLKMMDVSYARLRVTWRVLEGEPAKQLTFSVTVPDSTTLRDLPLHNVVKPYLKAWKLAP